MRTILKNQRDVVINLNLVTLKVQSQALLKQLIYIINNSTVVPFSFLPDSMLVVTSQWTCLGEYQWFQNLFSGSSVTIYSFFLLWCKSRWLFQCWIFVLTIIGCSQFKTLPCRSFVGCEHVRALIGIGCCYNLLSEDCLEKTDNSCGFPISNAAKLSSLVLGKNARDLACQVHIVKVQKFLYLIIHLFLPFVYYLCITSYRWSNHL